MIQNLKKEQVGWSPIDAELLSLDLAMKSCHYWLYFCEEVKLYSDCSGLLDMLKKPIDQILNLRHQKILLNIYLEQTVKSVM